MSSAEWRPIRSYGIATCSFVPIAISADDASTIGTPTTPRPVPFTPSSGESPLTFTEANVVNFDEERRASASSKIVKKVTTPTAESAPTMVLTATLKQISLDVGDDVYVIERYGAWLRGYNYRSDKTGLFPSSHVHRRIPRTVADGDNGDRVEDDGEDAWLVVDSTSPRVVGTSNAHEHGLSIQVPSAGDGFDIPGHFQVPAAPIHDTRSGAKEPLIDDIADALREWSIYIYVHLRNQDYSTYTAITNLIQTLYQGRRQLLADNLSHDGLTKLRRDLVSTLNAGNRLQKLDLIVRHPELGILADDEIYSINQLFNMQSALANTGEAKSTAVDQTGKFYQLCLDLKAFVASICMLGESVELHFLLYKSRSEKEKYLTESFCLVLNSHGQPKDDNKLDQMRTLFVDLSYRDFDENLWLVCKIIRNGKMNISDKEPTSPAKEFAGTSNSALSTSATLYPPVSTLGGSKMNIAAGTSATLRRPFGVAALRIGDILHNNTASQNSNTASLNSEFDMKIFVPKDENQFASLTDDIINGVPNLEESKKADKLRISLRLFSGDASQVVKDNSALLLGVPQTPRREFPDVVMPGIMRNELYFTLLSGDIQTGRKSAQKNIQVTIEVRLSSGEFLEDAISRASGEAMTSCDSMIIYHSNSPSWNETFKLNIPLDQFEDSHVFLTFRHCSTNEKEDKGEKAFAFGYLTLVPKKQSVVYDGPHTLHLCKLDKAWSDGGRVPDPSIYLDDALDVDSAGEQLPASPQSPSRPAVLKDVITVKTFLCSTKFTQNNNLLTLLHWKDLSENVGLAQAEQVVMNVLKKVRNIGELEVAKFLQDILDALFEIICSPLNYKDQLDDLAFPALIFILSIVGDRRFSNFRSILIGYIEHHFSASSAVQHLIGPLRRLVEDPTSARAKEILLSTIKVWEYLFGLIIRARLLQRESETRQTDPLSEANERHFKEELTTLLDIINVMMRSTRPEAVTTRTIALQHFPALLPDLSKVFPSSELVKIATAFADAVLFQKGGMTIYKSQLMHSFIRGPLFDHAPARKEITKLIIRWMTEMIQPAEGNYWRDTMKFCVTFVTEFLEKIQLIVVAAGDHGDDEDRQNVTSVLGLLPVIITAYNEAAASYVDEERAILIASRAVTARQTRDVTSGAVLPVSESTFKTMNSGLAEAATAIVAMILLVPENQLAKLLRGIHANRTFEGRAEFFVSLNSVFQSILTDRAYPTGWLNMIILAHKAIFKVMKPVAALLLSEFSPSESRDFRVDVWTSYFNVLHALIASPHVQVESLGPQKKRAAVRMTGDIRGEAVQVLLSTWNALGTFIVDPKVVRHEGSNHERRDYRKQVSEKMVGKILELSMSEHPNVQKCAVQILFDMICNRFEVDGKLSAIEREVIDKLDRLVMSEMKGDDDARKRLMSQLSRKFEKEKKRDLEFYVIVKTFLESANQFFELLLNVRGLPETEEYEEERMVSTLKLMRFIRQIDQDVFVKYVHQLVQMQLKSQNFLEAGRTLKMHTDLLNWDRDEKLEALLEMGMPTQTAFERKEQLLLQVMKYYNEGKGWELSIEICKELVRQYTIAYQYRRVADLLTQEGTLYSNIMTKERYQREYFRVGYYGRAFPDALRNRQFIYRGDEWERIAAFCERIQNRHPRAQLLKSNTAPGDEITKSEGQYLQITGVAPEPDRTQEVFTKGDSVDDPIRAYYEVNNVCKFSFSRPFRKASKSGNEFLDLWTEKTVLYSADEFPSLLRRSEVIKTETREISPVENAVNAMTGKNKELRFLAKKFGALAADSINIPREKRPKMNVNPFSMSVNGAVDAPVNGGVPMYKQAFFDEKYLENNPDKANYITQLRELINEQVRIIDECLEIHDVIVPPEMRPLHDNLLKLFKKNFVEEIGLLPAKDDNSSRFAAYKSPASVTVPVAPAVPPPSFSAPALPSMLPPLSIGGITHSESIATLGRNSRAASWYRSSFASSSQPSSNVSSPALSPTSSPPSFSPPVSNNSTLFKRLSIARQKLGRP